MESRWYWLGGLRGQLAQIYHQYILSLLGKLQLFLRGPTTKACPPQPSSLVVTPPLMWSDHLKKELFCGFPYLARKMQLMSILFAFVWPCYGFRLNIERA